MVVYELDEVVAHLEKAHHVLVVCGDKRGVATHLGPVEEDSEYGDYLIACEGLDYSVDLVEGTPFKWVGNGYQPAGTDVVFTPAAVSEPAAPRKRPVAYIVNDRLNDGTDAYWIDLGYEGIGITSQRQARTLKEAQGICAVHVVDGLILHLSGHGDEVETTYKVKGGVVQ